MSTYDERRDECHAALNRSEDEWANELWLAKNALRRACSIASEAWEDAEDSLDSMDRAEEEHWLWRIGKSAILADAIGTMQ